MKRVGILLLVVALGACGDAASAPAGTGNAGPPPLVAYQLRDEMPAGDRLAKGRDGAALFSNRCGACHLPGGMGTNMLTKQRIADGEPPESGLLANRTDLTQGYVKAVVRMGKVAMPPQTRVDLTDAELDAIARYLGKAGE